ncbi:protein of unknown function [Pseudodesulfovibrio piezophilus C1TLV30]|uniref:Uncharacterized protein n=1 Tax=Pseudodesulfovibrio piezophilus (strain DSM 21447 / JCM 15486 / C1TLV30) TaxID=1322246 RepID=M1WJS5_PSEP2|nr:protein of unknown function [Pseudodesulfovibrio piezophilus C1TLV30]
MKQCKRTEKTYAKKWAFEEEKPPFIHTYARNLPSPKSGIPEYPKHTRLPPLLRVLEAV